MSKKKKAISLRGRIAILTLAGIIFSVLLVGSISIFILRREKDADNARQMNLICDDYALTIDEFLVSVEQSVNMVVSFAIEDLDSVALMEGGVIGADGYGDFERTEEVSGAQAQELDRYLKAHVEKVCNVYKSVANHAQGAVSFYYRVNPELTEDAVGELYSRKGHAGFDRVELTDLSLYDADDMEHVGWYYTPLRSGRPVWMLPYNNLNLEEQMVSYVVPIYKAGTFIGVIGMDIGHQTLAELINQVKLYDTGYAYLTKADGEIIYHPTLPYEELMKGYTPESSPIMKYISEMNETGGRTAVYTYQGVTKAMAFHTLSNGLKLVVVAPVSEVNAQWHALINTIVIILLFILMLFAVITAIFTRRITDPLKNLTDASRQLIAGNYDVDLPYERSDEVGTLTEAFRSLTQHLKVYISDLNGRAYSDALTGIKNKGAFDIIVRKLNDGIQAQDEERTLEFAMIMLDCNDLKEINDVYGHDKGDIYLKTSCDMICRTFDHSPVFRIGGDEFVVLLQGRDYYQRDELLSEFERRCAEVNEKRTQPWERISLSKGIALYQAGKDENAEAVLNRADASMYEEKRSHKDKGR